MLQKNKLLQDVHQYNPEIGKGRGEKEREIETIGSEEFSSPTSNMGREGGGRERESSQSLAAKMPSWKLSLLGLSCDFATDGSLGSSLRKVQVGELGDENSLFLWWKETKKKKLIKVKDRGKFSLLSGFVDFGQMWN